MKSALRSLSAGCLALLLSPALNSHGADWVVYPGRPGPGHGKHVVFLSGDEEYRSEESLPMLARLLAERHGFTCTVLFAINPADHTIDPVTLTNIPGMQALNNADVCVIALRFRELPDEQMKPFVDYLNAGKPFIALRTSTHAFQYRPGSPSPYAKFDWRNRDWPGGFGQQVLGETWVSHHGEHGKESTRAVLDSTNRSNPLLRGVGQVWVPTDVYTVAHLPSNVRVLMWGEVLGGMTPDAQPVAGPKNNPLMPVAWVRNYTGAQGKTSKVFTTTMGAAVDLQDENLRRLLVNAVYWEAGLQVPAKADVRYVGEYKPHSFGFGKFTPGLKPGQLQSGTDTSSTN